MVASWKFLLLQVLAVATAVQSSTNCYSPSGIDYDSSVISYKQITDLLRNGVSTSNEPLPYLFLPLVDSFLKTLVASFEGPIQFRQAVHHANGVYSVVAMYDAMALDTWGQDGKRICTEEFDSDLELQVHSEVAAAYAFAYSVITFVPKCRSKIVDIMENILELPMSYLDGNPDKGTPWGLAKATIDQMYEYSKSDGWNADGHLTNTYNEKPFCDYTYNEYLAYHVVDAPPKSNKCKMEWHWQPLLETDGTGFFTRQEHVTPFAGYTGRLYGLDKGEYENFSVPAPEYDYCEEASRVLSTTNEMANDDTKKAMIEFFDSKFTSLVPMHIDWSIQNELSLFDFWYYHMVVVTTMYDAVLLVWREKVAYNAVRPTTVVKTLKGDEEIRSYAGPFAGSQVIKGMDWEPYIRTMPHAEYPSGSSCVCTTFAETMQVLTAKDAIGDYSVGKSFEPGSLKMEPGVTPSRTVNLFFDRWSDIQNDCGQSRLYGGMHFTKAVPAGKELCSGLAARVIDRTELLVAGDPSGALVDPNETDIIVKGRNNGENSPSMLPTQSPTPSPTQSPTSSPTTTPTTIPTSSPTKDKTSKKDKKNKKSKDHARSFEKIRKRDIPNEFYT